MLEPLGDLADAYPWPPGTPWLRAVMLRSLDGAVAGPDGLSGSLSSPTDRQVLAQARRLADAIVIGASTFRAERYRPLRSRDDAQEERRSAGQAGAPRLVIVSATLDLPWQEPAFAESAVQPLVVTGDAADPDCLREARDACEVLRLPGARVDMRQLVTALQERGLRRIVCEGGPLLLDAMLRAGLVDEMDLTLAPWLVGRREDPRADSGVAVPAEHTGFRLVAARTHEGFVFTRYLR